MPHHPEAIAFPAIPPADGRNWFRQVHQRLCAGVPGLVLELDDLERIDKQGLVLLLNSIGRIRQLDADVALAQPRPRVRAVFDLVGMNSFVDVFERSEAALEHLEGLASHRLEDEAA